MSSSVLLNPAYAPVLPFERPLDGSGKNYTPLGNLAAIVELGPPAAGAPSMGVQAEDIITFTQAGTLFVPRGADLAAGDRFTYQGRRYCLMGARNWDLDNPLDGTDFGWMTFAFQVDPWQLISDLLALRGQQIVLTPIVATAGAGGGSDYAPGTARASQPFVLFNTKGFDGRENSQTDRGTARKLEFQLVGASDAAIALGDKWEDTAAKYVVESIDLSRPYAVVALVIGFLKVQGHSFG